MYFQVNTARTASNCNIAIYATDGTRIAYTSGNTTLCNATGARGQSGGSAAGTLTGGTQYYFCWCSIITNVGFLGPGATTLGILGNAVSPLQSGTQTIGVGGCTTAGAVPATLGTLTSGAVNEILGIIK